MSAKRDGAAMVGVGAAACAACCAGPILGFLAAIGLGTAAGAFLFGIVGFAVALLAGVGLLIRRRRRTASASCTTMPATVVVATPTIRTPR